jgi:alpha-amylase
MPPVKDPGAVVAPVMLVKTSQATIRLVKGKAITLPAAGYTAAGERVAVAWTSSKPSVAKVSAAGRITAKKAGRATLTVTAGGKKATIKVTVVAKRPSPAKAKVKSVSARVPQVMAAGTFANAVPAYKPATATGVKVRYTSSRPAIVSVDQAGRLTAKTPGKATISITAGAKTKKYTLTVR